MVRKEIIFKRVKERKWLFIFLILLLLGSTLYLLLGGSTVIYKEVKTYPTGCVEVYENSILVEGNCSGERLVFDSLNNKTEYIVGYDLVNLSEFNIS